MTQLLDNRTIQRFLATKGLYKGPIDGIMGLGSRSGMAALVNNIRPTKGWPDSRIRVAAEQTILRSLGFDPGGVDGYVGPTTLDALERYQNKLRDIEPPAETIAHIPNIWPRERTMLEFYGKVGTNQTTLDLPYTMRIAWNTRKTVDKITCHAKVKDSLDRIFTAVLAAYGLGTIQGLGLDLFGGCLNVRRKKGGNSYSTHSWGAAIDLDPDHNQLRWGEPKARFSHKEYEPFWQIVEKEGWVSLGREKNYDWMHFQAARF